jgi:type II secretory pathway component HofQ
MTLATFVLATFLSAQLVSLDTTDMVMSDFLRFIAKTANLNLVIYPDVHGNVNVFVKDVPWEQVLDSVLKVHWLEKEVDGNTMRIAPAASLPLQTYVYYPIYLHAEGLARIVAPMLSPRGSVVVYPARNALIVRDIRPLNVDIR